MKPAKPAKRRLLGWLAGLFSLAAVALGLSAVVSQRPVCKVFTPKTDLANLQAALEAYRTALGKYPGGDASQILSALRGENASSNVFLTIAPRRLNAAGEYVDPWGTPYRITFDPSGQPLVYSFGPNRRDDQGRKDSDDITLDYPALVGRPIP